jgi:hypothetical protein
MTRAIEELKTRARLRLNAARKAGNAVDLRLRDCLHAVARNVGFTHWDHARRVLAGMARSGDDMGGFWYAPRCGVLINQWYADPDVAREAHGLTGGFLLPYRHQYMVVQDYFIRELGLDPVDAAWAEVRYDLVSHYGCAAWASLCTHRLKAADETFDGW